MGCEITTKMNPMDEIIDNLYLGDFNSANNINKLKEKNIIKRIGANKNGYWEIIK